MTELRSFTVTVRVVANNARAARNIMDICRRSGYFEEILDVKPAEQDKLKEPTEDKE